MSLHWFNSLRPSRLGVVFIAIFSAVLVSVGVVRAHSNQGTDATAPTAATELLVEERVAPSVSDEVFAKSINFSRFKSLSVQHNQTLKTWDTMSRQMLAAITGKGSILGQEPTFTVLDIAMRPQVYATRNIIRVRVIPLRNDLGTVPGVSAEEKRRILHEGTISLAFWRDPVTVRRMAEIQASAFQKGDGIQKVEAAAGAMESLFAGNFGFPLVAMIPPAKGSYGTWTRINEIIGNVPALRKFAEQSKSPLPAPLPDYDEAKVSAVWGETLGLFKHWQSRDAESVQKNLDALALALPQVNPQAYPSELKRNSEVFYNRLFNLTLPGAAFYFLAFVLFLISLRTQSQSVRLWGLRFFVIALLIHTAAIAIRWWLLEKSTDDWFHSIPIRNQFESVMFSAWFGSVVLLMLELWKGKSLYGTAAGFVGWLSLMAIFTVPYVLNISIGEQLGQVGGILMSYWLYIHVTLAVASYALIAATAFLGGLWLWTYYRARKVIADIKNHRQLASETADLQLVSFAGSGVIANPLITIARMLFIPVKASAAEGVQASSDAATASTLESSVVARLRQIDQCNLTVMQLAFWVLGVAIVFGAVWADVSWGRPWGWDPKETFALVTWMCYLVIVHIRYATEYKAWYTSVLSIIGFIVMLFNWIGVNYFLVGLHSYA